MFKGRSAPFFLNAFLMLSVVAASSNTAFAQSELQHEKKIPRKLSPAVSTLAINGMGTGLLVASAFQKNRTGLLYHPNGSSSNIHGTTQWPVLLGGLSGGAVGLGLGLVGASLSPPVSQGAQMAQAFAHLAIPLGTAGTMIVLQPNQTVAGLLALSGTVATVPISYLLSKQKIQPSHLYAGNLMAVNWALTAGSLGAIFAPQGALVGLPTLADRPIDMTIGAMVLAGTTGMLVGPLSQAYLPEKWQKKMTQMFWGGMLGCATGWAVGLASRSVWGENDFAGAASVGLVGQLAGLLAGSFVEREE